MKELSYEVWNLAWNRWPDRPIIHCSYCNGLHPANELCFAKFKKLSKNYASSE